MHAYIEMIMNYFVSDLPDSDFVPADLEREGEYVAEGEEDGDPFDGEDERNVQGTHSCFFFSQNVYIARYFHEYHVIWSTWIFSFYKQFEKK